MSLDQFLQELQEDDREITHTGLLRLSNLGPDEAVLMKRYWHGIALTRRRSIMDRLVQMAEDNVELDFTTLLKLCLQDSDGEVRQKAISGLWECEDRSLIPRLIELLQGDPSVVVRAAAAMGLGRFAQLAVEGKLLEKDKERLEAALLGVVREPDHPQEVRRRALEAIAPFNTQEIQGFVRQAYEGSHQALRCSALYAMGRSCDTQWFPLLVKELKSSDPAMRYEAASACGELGNEEAVPHLAPLVRDEDYQVQLAAIQALGHIGGRQARRLLQAQLDAPDEGIAEAAEEALRQIEVEEDPLTP